VSQASEVVKSSMRSGLTIVLPHTLRTGIYFRIWDMKRKKDLFKVEWIKDDD